MYRLALVLVFLAATLIFTGCSKKEGDEPTK